MPNVGNRAELFKTRLFARGWNLRRVGATVHILHPKLGPSPVALVELGTMRLQMHPGFEDYEPGLRRVVELVEAAERKYGL